MKNSYFVSLIICIIFMSGLPQIAEASDPPVPEVSASISAVQTNINSQFSVEFTIGNSGEPSSTDSYLSISISHGLDIVSWTSNPSLSDLSFDIYMIGDLIWNNKEEQIPAEYVLLDVWEHPFDTGDLVTVTIVFESASTQSLNEWIKYRAAMLPEGVNYPTEVPTIRNPSSSDEVDQQGYPVYKIEVDVWSPWDDWDGDGMENFIDINSERQSLLDYGVPENRIYVATVNYGDWWKFEVATRVYLIAPETEDEVVILTDWIKEHTASQDYEYITSELLDYYFPCFIAFEIDKDVLTVLPMIGTLFDFLPGDDTLNWVRIISPLAFPDPLPLLQIASSPQLMAQLIYSFPCITDGDGYTSHLTGEELLFRFTRPMELSLENVVDFAVDLLTLGIGQFLTGALPLKEFAKLAADLVVDFMFRLAWKWIKAQAQAISEGYRDLLATLLQDPEGDVDMALFVDEEFVLGSNQNVTISSSMYGEYLGDFPTELMITYTSQIVDHNVTIMVTASDVTEPENVSLQWMSFKETSLVANGTFQERFSEETSLKEYEIFVDNNIPNVISEFSSIVILPLFMVIILLVVIFLNSRKKPRTCALALI